MRFAVVAALFWAPILGLGYTYGLQSPAPIFLTAPVERGSIATLVKASGTVEAVVSVDVSSQLSGRIAQVFVNFNDTVKAGQPIAQIDPEIFAARVNEGRAALNVGAATAHVQKAGVEREGSRAECADLQEIGGSSISGDQGQARRTGEGSPAKAPIGPYRECNGAGTESGASSAGRWRCRPERIPRADSDEG